MSRSPRPGTRARRALDAVRVVDAPAEHLVAAAEPEHPPAAPDMGADVDVPALRAQEGRGRRWWSSSPAAARGRRTGIGSPGRHQHHARRRARPGAGRGRRNWRCAAAPARPRPCAGPRRRPSPRAPRASSAGRRAASGKCGISPRLGQPVARRDGGHAVGEQARVAAELVDEEAPDHRGVGRVDHRLGADEAGDDAAPVDVAEQDHRRVRRRGRSPYWRCRRRRRLTSEAEPAPSTTTRSASRLQVREALQHRGEQARLPGLVVPRLGGADHAALDHDLAAGLALGLQQHRVHVHGGRDAGRPRLQRLGPADLAAIGGDGGVVRHVLRLERPHARARAGRRPGTARRRSATCRHPSRCPGS